jgi:hypothetical protein
MPASVWNLRENSTQGLLLLGKLRLRITMAMRRAVERRKLQSYLVGALRFFRALKVVRDTPGQHVFSSLCFKSGFYSRVFC